MQAAAALALFCHSGRKKYGEEVIFSLNSVPFEIALADLYDAELYDNVAPEAE